MKIKGKAKIIKSTGTGKVQTIKPKKIVPFTLKTEVIEDNKFAQIECKGGHYEYKNNK